MNLDNYKKIAVTAIKTCSAKNKNKESILLMTNDHNAAEKACKAWNELAQTFYEKRLYWTETCCIYLKK